MRPQGLLLLTLGIVSACKAAPGKAAEPDAADPCHYNSDWHPDCRSDPNLNCEPEGARGCGVSVETYGCTDGSFWHGSYLEPCPEYDASDDAELTDSEAGAFETESLDASVDDGLADVAVSVDANDD